MKILYLSTWYPYPPDNGSRIRAFRLLEGLAQKNKVTLIAFTDSDQMPKLGSEIGMLAEEIITLPRRTFEPRRAAALAAFFSNQPRSLADTFDASAQKRIHEIACRSFDVIVAGELSMAVYARRLAHPAKIFDDAETGLFADAYYKARGVTRWRNALTWFKYARFLRALGRDFDVLTVVSRLEQTRLNQIGIPEERIELIPNGVDCGSNENPGKPPQPLTLIYNGALTYSANYDAMRYFTSEILPLIRASEPGVLLKITGRAPQFAINELSQDNVVSFTGYVEDARAEVRSSAVCVVPLREGGGTRLKILEAMAVGTPVVTTSKGAEGLELKHGEHLLIADSPDAFAQATIRLLREEPLRTRLVRAAREQVSKEYDWRRIQARMAEIVTSLAEAKGEFENGAARRIGRSH